MCLGPCADAERQACEAEWNADHDEAVSEGCEEQFGVYSDCIVNGTGCVNADYDAGCLDHKGAWQQCVTG